MDYITTDTDYELWHTRHINKLVRTDLLDPKRLIADPAYNSPNRMLYIGETINARTVLELLRQHNNAAQITNILKIQ